MSLKVWYIIGCIITLPVDSLQILKSTTKHVEGDQSKIVILQWRYSKNQTDVLKEVYVRYKAKQLETCSFNKSDLNCPTKMPIKYKLTVNSIRQIFQLEIYNLSYADRGLYDGEIATEGDMKYHLHGIQVKVRGPLFICGDQLDHSYIFVERFSPKFNVTLCGYPQPLSTEWRLNSNPIKKMTKIPHEGDFKNEYQVELSPLTPKSCGKRLYFKAQNGLNTVTTSTLIYVDFFPPTVHEIRVEETDECLKVSWQLTESGECKVKYLLETKRNHTSLGSYTTEPFVDNIQICVNKQKWRKREPITAQVRSILFNRYGNWSKQVMAITPTETSSSKTALIVGLTLGSVILLLLLLVLLFYKRERKRSSSKDYRPTKSPPMSKTDFIDVSLLNLQKSKNSAKSDYIDMSGSLQTGSQYTQVNEREAFQPSYTKLNTEDELYENMNEFKAAPRNEPEQSEYEIPNRI